MAATGDAGVSSIQELAVDVWIPERGKLVFAQLKLIMVPLMDSSLNSDRICDQLRLITASLPQFDHIGLAACFQYVSFPLTHLLRQSKDERVYLLSLNTLDALCLSCGFVEKSESFVDVFLFLLQSMTRPASPLSETLHCSLLHSLRVLFSTATASAIEHERFDDDEHIETMESLNRTSFTTSHQNIRQVVCSTEFRLSLGFLISHLLQCALVPKSLKSAQLPRQSRCEALQFILSICQCVEQTCSDSQSRAKIISSFLPGIASTTVKIITGDVKQGSRLVRSAIQLFSQCVSLALADQSLDSDVLHSVLPAHFVPSKESSNTISVNNENSITSLMQCLQGLALESKRLSVSSNQVVQQAPALSTDLQTRIAAFVSQQKSTIETQHVDSERSDSKLVVHRDNQWLSSSLMHIHSAIEQVFAQTLTLYQSPLSTSAWRVRLQFAQGASLLLARAPLVLHGSVSILIECLIALCLDPIEEVASTARRGMSMLLQNPQQRPLLADLLIVSLGKRIQSLKDIKIQNESHQLHSIQLIRGLVEAISALHLPRLIVCIVDQTIPLLSALKSLLELDPNDTGIVERESLTLQHSREMNHVSEETKFFMPQHVKLHSEASRRAVHDLCRRVGDILLASELSNDSTVTPLEQSSMQNAFSAICRDMAAKLNTTQPDVVSSELMLMHLLLQGAAQPSLHSFAIFDDELTTKASNQEVESVESVDDISIPEVSITIDQRLNLTPPLSPLLRESPLYTLDEGIPDPFSLQSSVDLASSNSLILPDLSANNEFSLSLEDEANHNTSTVPDVVSTPLNSADLRADCLSSVARSLTQSILKPALWRLPTTHSASDAPGDVKQYRSHALVVSLALRMLATLAAVSPREFRQFGVIGALHVVVEKLADPNTLVALSARAALESIAISCGYASPISISEATTLVVPQTSVHTAVRQLVVSNADYLIDALSLKLRSNKHSLSTPLMLQALLCHTGAPAAQLVPLLDDTIQLSIDAFDSLLADFAALNTVSMSNVSPHALTTFSSQVLLSGNSDHFSVESQLDAYLSVLAAFVRAVAEMHFNQNSDVTQSSEKLRTAEIMMPLLTPAEFRKRVLHSCEELRDLYVPSIDADDSFPAESNESDKFVKEEKGTGARPEQLLVTQILRRVQTLILARSLNIHQQRVINQLVQHACQALSDCEKELLPALAQLWQALRPRLLETLHDTRTSSSQALIIKQSSDKPSPVEWTDRASSVIQTMDLLCKMAQFAPKFLAQHFAKDVWPTLRTLLKREQSTIGSGEVSTLKWTDFLPSDFQTVTHQTLHTIRPKNSRTLSSHTQIQISILKCLSLVLSYPDMGTQWVDEALALCLVYFQDQPAVLCAETVCLFHNLMPYAYSDSIVAALQSVRSSTVPMFKISDRPMSYERLFQHRLELRNAMTTNRTLDRVHAAIEFLWQQSRHVKERVLPFVRL